MPPIPSTTPSATISTSSVPRVKKATVASVSSQPKVSTAQALKGYHYLKSRSSHRSSST